MPPKKEEARAPSASSARTDEFIEALKDPAVAEAIASALGPFIARAIDAALDTKLTELKSVIAGLTLEASSLKSTVGAVQSENARLKTLVEDQGKRLEEMEIYSRAHDLIIRGLPESTYAERASASAQDTDTLMSESHSSVERSVLALCNEKLAISVGPRDISVAHRLKAGKNDKHRPIIVRFTSRRIRDEVLRAKKKLIISPSMSSRDSTQDMVFISEHLTRGVSSLFFEARKLVREKRLTAAWTHKGLVNIKFTNNVNEKPTIIQSQAELSRPRI